MARFKKKGDPSSLSGLIGDVVVVSGGVLRSRPRRTKKKPTANEQHNQSKFALVGAFIEPFYPFMKAHFKDLQGKKTARDAIRSYHLLNATLEEAGGFAINYPKVLMSCGRLQGLHATEVLLEECSLTVVWQNNSLQALASATDLLSIIAFNATAGEAHFFENCAARGDGQVLLTFPEYFPTGQVHLWGTFEDPATGDVANSIYLGLIEGE